MKMLLLILFLSVTAWISADTYSLYVVKTDNQAFNDRIDQVLLSDNQDAHALVMDNQKYLSIIAETGIVVDLFVQTEGADVAGKGTDSTYQVEYTDDWDEEGNPKSRATREVGVRFQIIERGNSIHVDFQETRLEGWIFGSPARPQWRPLFATRKISTEVSLEKGKTIVMGDLVSEEVHGGVSRKMNTYIFIAREE